MQPLYKIGENTAFGYLPSSFTVANIEQFVREDGGVTERMWDSGNNSTSMDRGPYRDDPEYHPIKHPPRNGGILAPHAAILERASSRASLPEATEFVDVSGDVGDYWRALCDYWQSDFDLKICEHDVIWRPDIDESFDSCPEPWCVFKYCEHSEGDAEAWANAIGCVRYRKELIADIPNAVVDVEPRFRDWHYLCDGLGQNLRKYGYMHHWHGVVHHQCRSHDGDS